MQDRDKLAEKGFSTDSSRAKSAVLTEEGVREAKKLLEPMN
ncbi:MAG: DUF6429 family protein [Bacillota bacterium]|nr:DUF6429 family protein [Bacillota bacterium]HOA90193.1 DUF6429 family protein [Bacillota bacterium]HOL13778.1 DUF6429 family protein [Bacillota bacterium]HOP53942.1 DUF6429 family protein [Bacillota bacterium]HPQ11156.1 DUF6429 family protein [Bacillota bacterium]